MTKQEIRQQLEAKGLLKTNNSRDPLWIKAFELFNEGQRIKLKMGCGSCFNKVRSWLAN